MRTSLPKILEQLYFQYVKGDRDMEKTYKKIR